MMDRALTMKAGRNEMIKELAAHRDANLVRAGSAYLATREFKVAEVTHSSSSNDITSTSCVELSPPLISVQCQHTV